MQSIDKNLATILLVEDSLADIALTKALIKDQKIRLNLLTARDSVEAEKILSNNNSQVDLVILDCNLPKVSGLEVLLDIKKRFDISIVMFSGSDAPADQEKAKELGAVDYMVKPFQLNDFKAAITKINDLDLIDEEGFLCLKKKA